MEKDCNNDLSYCYEKAFNELYTINTLISMVKRVCEEREYKGEYYNISKEKAVKLSKERNDYINVLTIISDRLSNIIELNLLMESKIPLK